MLAHFFLIFLSYLLRLCVDLKVTELDKNKLNQYVVICDAKGQFISKYGDMQNYIPFNQIPKSIIDALLATEDKLFWEHGGINLASMIRAGLLNLASFKVLKGGSTITQQLAKNLLLNNEAKLYKRKTERKVKEFLIALKLEANLTKAKILEYYLNRIYFGRGAYGISAAAKIYLDKPVNELNLKEISYLIGLVQAPTRYGNNHAKALERANHVLNRLYKLDIIDEEELRKYKLLPVNVGLNSVRFYLGQYSDWILTQIPKWIRESNRSIKVYTTLDQELQQKIVHYLPTLHKGSRFVFSELAFICCDRDGAIRAMLGSFNNVTHGFNRVTQAFRPAGSIFKIYTYLTGFLNGLNTDELISDTPPTIGDWSPSNYYHKEVGFVTVAQSFAQSINASTVRIAMRYGVNKIINTARLLGLTGSIPPDCSMILGSGCISLFELAETLLIISSQGCQTIPYGITKICDFQTSEVLWEHSEEYVPIRLINNETALDKMLYVFREVVESPRGTGRIAKSTYPVGGKTGTSQDYRDVWFGCISPFMVACCWCGHDDNRPMVKLDLPNLKNPSVALCKYALDQAQKTYSSEEEEDEEESD